MSSEPLVLDGQALALDDVSSVARTGRAVQLGPGAQTAMQAARQLLERRAEEAEPIYGVNTGFGSLASVRIEPDAIREVQRNLIRSHAAGVGDPLPDDVVRAMLVILAASLGRGRSGVRIEVVTRIIDLLNAGITPVVPSRGSVGASGDLAPLAHAALVLIGEGEARVNDRQCSGAAALKAAGLEPITLDAKEGLALINGTHLMSAIGSLVLCDVQSLSDASIAAAAMGIDACRATDATLDERLHAARGQPGQVRVAEQLRRHLVGSQIIEAHKIDDPRVQDPYCLRAAPQVMGAAFDTIDFVRNVFEKELGAVTDNPLIFADDGDILPGGNFHGMPLAIALDTLTIALCHVAGIAERRINWLLTASDSENPVNIYLSPQPGLHSGLMITQYTAAACCNELQTLAAPASVANIPTSAGIEDYNSFGVTSAHQARAAVDLAINVVAIELLVMAEALEYQRPLRSGEGVERTHDRVRSVVPRLTEDRPPAPDIAAIAQLIRDGAFRLPDA
ncbi:MAG: histidine ammonia-lyase [Planctomycetes bacterium]|nr:histidine ammonia-lyase [Planctomycetota bacterium]